MVDGDGVGDGDQVWAGESAEFERRGGGEEDGGEDGGDASLAVCSCYVACRSSIGWEMQDCFLQAV